MPTNPEASGSLYPLAAEIPDGPFTIFRAHMVENGQIAGWEYFGEYTHETVGQMIPELYGAIGHLFQQQWASNIRSDEASLAVRRIRARIALRKAGAPITAAAVDAEANTARLPLISKDDVIRAFKCGQEHHDHIRVKCVSYDQALVANMAAAYPEWLRVTKFRNANKTKKGKEKKK
ncbi:hypothetical protein C8R46DRAFT_436684 [Mycena filopes]|nr:hypothetical protein C8R46DRAFT_436684 [Mycena filopes]